MKYHVHLGSAEQFVYSVYCETPDGLFEQITNLLNGWIHNYKYSFTLILPKEKGLPKMANHYRVEWEDKWYGPSSKKVLVIQQ